MPRLTALASRRRRPVRAAIGWPGLAHGALAALALISACEGKSGSAGAAGAGAGTAAAPEAAAASGAAPAGALAAAPGPREALESYLAAFKPYDCARLYGTSLTTPAYNAKRASTLRELYQRGIVAGAPGQDPATVDKLAGMLQVQDDAAFLQQVCRELVTAPVKERRGALVFTIERLDVAGERATATVRDRGYTLEVTLVRSEPEGWRIDEANQSLW